MKIFMVLIVILVAGCSNDKDRITKATQEKQYDYAADVDSRTCRKRSDSVTINYAVLPQNLIWPKPRYITLGFKADVLDLSIETDAGMHGEFGRNYIEYDEKTLSRFKYYLNKPTERNTKYAENDANKFIARLNNSPVKRDFHSIIVSLLLEEEDTKAQEEALECAKYRVEQIIDIVKIKYKDELAKEL